MKIHAYQVSEEDGFSLAEALRALAARNRDARFIDDSPTAICLEDFQEAGGILRADFMRRRIHGPGRYRRGEPLGGFNINIEEGESFAEETALVLDPRLSFVAVQYNHFGPRALPIVDYVDAADVEWFHQGRNIDRAFDFAIRLRPDTYARLRRMNLYRQVEVKISVPGVAPQDRQRGQPLSRALDNVLGGTEDLNITLSAGPQRASTFRRDEFFGVINEAQRLGAAVKRLVVKAKEDEDSRAEQFDFFKDRLEEDIDVQVGQDGRYPRDVRWRVLCDTLDRWSRAGALR